MLLIVFLALVDFGLCRTTVEKCYGSSYEFPLHFTFPVFKDPIYYTPRGGQRKLVVSGEESKDNRFWVLYGRIRMHDLTEQDDGGVLYFGGIDSVKFLINDCQGPISTFYGFQNTWKIPLGAKYMEFSHLPPQGYARKPKMIWNRTNGSLSRGTVDEGHYVLKNLRQNDNGHYTFRDAKGRLIEWSTLIVKEFERQFTRKVGESLSMDFSVKFTSARRILFTPQGSYYERRIERPYMDGRMQFTDSYLSISDLKHEDSGTYRIVDDDEFVAMSMEVEVDYPPAPAWIYILFLVIIVLCIVLCCCCVKKCCCKKGSNKRNSAVNQAAASPPYYHNASQPTQPVVPLLEREPRGITADAPKYNSRNLPTSTQVTITGGQGPASTSTVTTSSDSGPQFEFKGMVFPSAPPLSSDTSISNVYTSDKLNFL